MLSVRESLLENDVWFWRSSDALSGSSGALSEYTVRRSIINWWGDIVVPWPAPMDIVDALGFSVRESLFERDATGRLVSGERVGMSVKCVAGYVYGVIWYAGYDREGFIVTQGCELCC